MNSLKVVIDLIQAPYAGDAGFRLGWAGLTSRIDITCFASDDLAYPKSVYL